jgi:hypothetical protein
MRRKSSLPFFIRTCQALEIPFVVLHDDDIYPEPADAVAAIKVRKENEDARKLNERIA